MDGKGDEGWVGGCLGVGDWYQKLIRANGEPKGRA